MALLRRALDPFEDFWTSLLRSLRTGGLNGVKLVMPDAHSGLKNAISTIFQGAGWQRCRVHFMRNVLAAVPKAGRDMVASIIRSIFAQPDAKHIAKEFAEVTTMLDRSHPKVAAVLTDAEPDLLAFAEFPQRHWRQIWSTNPLERVNKEIKRRTPLLLPSLHARTDHDEQPHRNHRRGDDPPGTRRRLS